MRRLYGRPTTASSATAEGWRAGCGKAAGGAGGGHGNLVSRLDPGSCGIDRVNECANPYSALSIGPQLRARRLEARPAIRLCVSIRHR
jgi:hypothetical protein